MDKTRTVTGEEASTGKDVLSLLVKANRGEDGKNFLSEDQMSASGHLASNLCPSAQGPPSGSSLEYVDFVL